MLKTSVIIALVCCGCVVSCAEQVTLKNGDRISGTIVNMSDKKLTVKTDYAGPVTIDWAAVAQFTSEQPMVITRTDKQVVTGSVNAQESSVVVTTSSGTQTIPKDDVVVLRSQADQAAYEKSLHPGFLEGWAGGGSFGVALARGNSDTTSIATGFNADRKTTTDEWTLTFAQLYSKSTTDNVSTTGANLVGGTIRYAHNITPRIFGFGLLAALSDQSQDLNERLSPSGGLGFHVIASKVTTLDVLGGIGYTYENYSSPPPDGLVNNFINATVGEEFSHNFTANTVVTENLYFFPYLNDAGNYRGTFNFGIASKFYKAFTWNLNFGDLYNSEPVPGKKNNDVILTTGLGITFGKPK